jgi:DNA-binding transcriptional MerR regulator
MTIGALSREFGITLRAARFYENKGLIAPTRDGLTRLFSAADVAKLRAVLKGKKYGLTLGEIRQLIVEDPAVEGGFDIFVPDDKLNEQVEFLTKQKAEIEAGLDEIAQMKAKRAKSGS